MAPLSCPHCRSSERFRLFGAYPTELYVSPKEGDPLAHLEVQMADEPYIEAGECLSCGKALPAEFLQQFRLSYLPEKR